MQELMARERWQGVAQRQDDVGQKARDTIKLMGQVDFTLKYHFRVACERYYHTLLDTSI